MGLSTVYSTTRTIIAALNCLVFWGFFALVFI